MRVWLVTCIVLFVGVQFFQWVKGFFLPLPIYILAGAFLSIASNYDKGLGSLFNSFSQGNQTLSQSATLLDPIPSLEGEKIAATVLESENTLKEK